MRRKIFLSCFFVIVFAFLYFFSTEDRASTSIKEASLFTPQICTSLLVGKNATVDGSVICTQSADCGNCDIRLEYVPSATYEPGAKRIVKGWNVYDLLGTKGSPPVRSGLTFEIPQVPQTYAYVATTFPFMNEHQLALGEATLIGIRSELAPSENSDAKIRITDLSRIALERAKSARDAIRIMAALMEEHGFNAWTPDWMNLAPGGHDACGEYFAVADKDEVWCFEFLPVGPDWKKNSAEPGVCWCAMRIPDGMFAVNANESIIGEIDLTDKDNFMASSNVTSLAEKHGWWNPKSGEPFRWDLAYTGKRANSLRTWRALSMVAPSKNLKPNDESYPIPIKPDKKLSVLDIRKIHGDRFEGTEFDQTKGLASGPFGCPNWPYGAPDQTRALATMSSDSIIINQCRDWLPAPIGGVMWVGLGGGDINVYVPFYAGVNRLPKAYMTGVRTRFDWDSAFWVYELVGTWAQLNYISMIKEIQTAQNRIESAELGRLAVIDEEAWKLYQENPSLARDHLTNYCVENANEVVKSWRELAGSFISRYSFGTASSAESYVAPDWWKKAIGGIE
ncbi:MAG: C69 family dipeptidase [Candidatus Aminicenantes bacterium]|nr:C69 family dipeptidase [Candidatus Aminicenantes bacterium]